MYRERVLELGGWLVEEPSYNGMIAPFRKALDLYTLYGICKS